MGRKRKVRRQQHGTLTACRICGAFFTSYRKQGRFCSVKCRVRNHRANARATATAKASESEVIG